jgi:hypothetical protein
VPENLRTSDERLPRVHLDVARRSLACQIGLVGSVYVIRAVAAAFLALSPAAAPSPSPLPPVKHVFVIVLENKNYDETWSAGSAAPYLAKVLRGQGKLLTNYYGIGHLSLDNYIAMVSGQPPNPQTQADCQRFTDFVGTVGSDGIAVGQGCVYPPSVPTVADQLEAKGLTWKGYMQDMGDNPARDQGSTCAHPPVGPTSNDATQTAAADDQYATRHNPFVYFHSIIDRPSCAANDVPLSHLPGDLSSSGSTASFSFITPDLCNDGHDASCASGEPGGLTQAGHFLEQWVPRILASPGYLDGGMLVITFDEAEAGGSAPDASACCGEVSGPNSPMPGIFGPGGGRVGALVISPFVTPGTTSDTPYNHYSLLRTVEDVFGLSHLGYAGANGLASFGGDVFDAPVSVGNGVVSSSSSSSSSGVSGSPSPSARGRLAATGADSTLLAAVAALLLVLGVALRKVLR